MSFNCTKTTFTLALLFAATIVGYGNAATAPAEIVCTEESWTSYSINGTQDSRTFRPAWFENWKTPTPGYFLFEFTTNARQDVCLAFHPTLFTSTYLTGAMAPMIGMRIGANGNSQIYMSVNQRQGFIGIGSGMISAAGGAIPSAGYDTTIAGFGFSTSIKVEFNIVDKILRIWSKKPSDTNYPALPFFDSTTQANATFTRDLTALLNGVPIAATAQYIGFSNGYKAHPGSRGMDTVMYSNVRTYPATPPIISCTQEAWTTYSLDASNDSTSFRPAWLESWKTTTPGNFLFEFTTNAAQDALIAFHPTLVTNTANAPLIGLRIGGAGNTQILMSANQPQGAIGVGNNMISAAGGAIPIANYDTTAAGFTDPATTIKVEFNIPNKTLRLSSKKPSDTSYPATPFFDSTAPANAAFATALTGLLNSVPTAATAQYIGFGNGYKAHPGSKGKDIVQYGNVRINPN